MFERTEAGLLTARGRSPLYQCRVVSISRIIQVFSTAMDWIVRDVSEKDGWDVLTTVSYGLGANSVFLPGLDN